MYTKKRGYLATIATIAEYDYLLHERLCRGNASPGSNQAEFLDACLASLPSLMRIGLLRADSASYRHTVLNWCEAKEVPFLVCARLDSAVREAADSLPSTSWQWRKEQNGDHFWIAEKTHILNKGVAPFRLIFIRRPLKRGQYQQGALFSGCELVAALATNLEDDIDSVLHRYRQRGESENRIKEWKNGFAAGRPPCSKRDVNAVWMRLNTLAYNLFILMRRTLWKPQRWQIQTIRWRFYYIAGQLIDAARRIVIKVHDRHYQTLNACQRRLYDSLTP